MKLLRTILAALVFLVAVPSAAQTGDTSGAAPSASGTPHSPASYQPTQNPSPPSTGTSTRIDWLSSFEFWMSFSVLSFGVFVFLVEVALVKLTRFKPEQTIKLLAVTLIIVSTLFIITAGFDSEQIAPAMGLFGTVAGYMLGRNSGKQQEDSE